MPQSDPRPGGLRRALGLADAVSIGAAAMLGAGVFVVFAPATRAAGSLLLVSLTLAAVVGGANALSTAQLAAEHPVAGGAYSYGRLRLGPWPGFAAGWMFVVGKLASCAAIALTIGAYLWPGFERPVGIAAVLVMTAVNLAGVSRTARAARASVVVVVTVLAVAVIVGLLAPPSSPLLGAGAGAGAGAAPTLDASWTGVVQGAGLLFFAFAGYARIATLGEEVRDPARTIPRAIVVTLLGVLALYAIVAGVLLLRLGPAELAQSSAPLLDLVRGQAWARPVMVLGAVIAALGSLLTLLAGVSRTAYAMAGQGDLPRTLARVSARRRVPLRAEVLAAAIVIAVLAVADLRGAIAFSSAGVLLYYLVANVAALTQTAPHRRYPRAVSVVGAVGCLALVVALPVGTIAVAALVLTVGVVGRLVGRRRGGRPG